MIDPVSIFPLCIINPQTILAPVPLPAALDDNTMPRREGWRPRLRPPGEPWVHGRIAKRSRAWRRPARARVLAIRDRLREIHGIPTNTPHGHPIAELVRTVLSQNTNDRNRDVAFMRMRSRFESWEQVRDAPVDELIEALRPGGLALTKAPRIQQILRQLDPQPDLDWLESANREEAIEFLTALPGVGRKTAACVLIFSFDLPEIPVDTHVHRVGGRLGLFKETASFEEAHDEMLAITPPSDAYEFHVNLIRHGRTFCRPNPRCVDCDLARMCPWRRTHPPGADMLPRRK